MGNLDELISKVIEIEFADEFKELEKDSNKVLDKDELIKKIVSIFKSEKIIYIIIKIYFGFEMKTENSGCLFSILANNPKNKYYFIQIIFEVLEKLKIEDWYKELKKIIEILGNQSEMSKLKKKNNTFNEKIKKKKN